MKAGIVTIFDMGNVGNRLQNYAVTQILRGMGVDCETLVPRRPPKSPQRLEQEEAFRSLLESDPIAAQQEKPLLCRSLRFEGFTDRHIPLRKLMVSQFGPELGKEYDVFITGSDQVWNPMFKNATGQVHNRLLAFAPAEKRICFAPSIGLDQIPDNWHRTYVREWSKYRRLSVRENDGAEIIRKLTGRQAQVVIDPVLMLDRQHWSSLQKPLPGFEPKSGYVLCYLLTAAQESAYPETEAAVMQQAEKKGLEVVHLFDRNDPVLQSAGPEEILSLFAGASLIYTDSFHGAVLSVLFGKPFVLTERKLEMKQREIDMSSRMTTLLEKLGLEDRLPVHRQPTGEAIWRTDYADAYARLNRERAAALRFLRISLGLER